MHERQRITSSQQTLLDVCFLDTSDVQSLVSEQRKPGRAFFLVSVYLFEALFPHQGQ